MNTEPASCECHAAGYCHRHGVEKVAHWHQLCQTRPEYRAMWDAGRGPGQNRPPPATAINLLDGSAFPCEHRTPDPVRTGACDLCCSLKGQPIAVFGCGLLGGECTPHRVHSQIKGCAACQHRLVPEVEPPPEAAIAWSRRDHIAPLRGVSASGRRRPWEGVQRPGERAWDRAATVMLPVCDPGEQLPTVLETWRRQTVAPHLLVVDTGSHRDNLLTLWDRFDGQPDVEIHALRSHGYRGSSEPVTQAIDVALAVCQTEWLLLTHDDVFARRPDVIEWLIWLSRRFETPVVGWEMSDRSHLGIEEWRGMVSHTCTLLHLPSLHGLNWSMRRAHDEFSLPRGHASLWPDTETGFNLLLRREGITPLLLGPEKNGERQVTRWWDHCRSLTGSGLYGNPYHEKAKGWVAEARAEAETRLAAWSA